MRTVVLPWEFGVEVDENGHYLGKNLTLVSNMYLSPDHPYKRCSTANSPSVSARASQAGHICVSGVKSVAIAL